MKKNKIIAILIIVCFIVIFFVRKSFFDAIFIMAFGGTLFTFSVVLFFGSMNTNNKLNKIKWLILSIILFAGALFAVVGVFTGLIQYDPNSRG